MEAERKLELFNPLQQPTYQQCQDPLNFILNLQASYHHQPSRSPFSIALPKQTKRSVGIGAWAARCIRYDAGRRQLSGAMHVELNVQ